MENKNKDKKQNNDNIPQSVNEVESLNDSDELDLESLETIAGADGCIIRGKNGGCFIRWDKSKKIDDHV